MNDKFETVQITKVNEPKKLVQESEYDDIWGSNCDPFRIVEEVNRFLPRTESSISFYSEI